MASVGEDIDEELELEKLQSLYEELINSAWEGNAEKVVDLMRKVPHLNRCDREGFTVLHAAASTGKTNLIQLLIDNGACVNQQSKTKLTPLHIAVQEYLPETVRLLLKNGADKTLKDENGNTPLHQATQFIRYYLHMIDVLEEEGLSNPSQGQKLRFPMMSRRFSLPRRSLSGRESNQSLGVLSEDQELKELDTSGLNEFGKKNDSFLSVDFPILNNASSRGSKEIRLSEILTDLDFEKLLQSAFSRPSQGFAYSRTRRTSSRTSGASTNSSSTDTSSSRGGNPSSSSLVESLQDLPGASLVHDKEARDEETKVEVDPLQSPEIVGEKVWPEEYRAKEPNLQSGESPDQDFNDKMESCNYVKLSAPGLVMEERKAVTTSESNNKGYELMTRLKPCLKVDDTSSFLVVVSGDDGNDDDDGDDYYDDDDYEDCSAQIRNVFSRLSANIECDETADHKFDKELLEKTSISSNDFETYEKLTRKHFALLIDPCDEESELKATSSNAGRVKDERPSNDPTNSINYVVGEPLYERLHFVAGKKHLAPTCNSKSDSHLAKADDRRRIGPSSDSEVLLRKCDLKRRDGERLIKPLVKDIESKTVRAGMPEASKMAVENLSPSPKVGASVIYDIPAQFRQKEEGNKEEDEEDEEDHYSKPRSYTKKRSLKKEALKWIASRKTAKHLGRRQKNLSP